MVTSPRSWIDFSSRLQKTQLGSSKIATWRLPLPLTTFTASSSGSSVNLNMGSAACLIASTRFLVRFSRERRSIRLPTRM